MEQNYLFLHDKHRQLFTIKVDTINEKIYKNIMDNNIHNIIKSNDLSGKYSLVNLYNGASDNFDIDDNIYNKQSDEINDNSNMVDIVKLHIDNNR
jgi:hypothetical protein